MPVLDLVTPQNNILYLSTALAVFDTVGSPEGVEDAVLGSLCLDTSTGNWYRKTSALGTLTGWTLFSGGGGGTPGAPVNSFQFNNAGSFGGVATITYDAPYLRIGDGAGSGAIKLYGNQAFHTFFALLAPPQDALENETYFWCDNPPTVTGEMFYALTKGANTTFGWTSNMTYDPVGRLSIDVTQNQSAYINCNNLSSGANASARMGVSATTSFIDMIAYSSGFGGSGLRTANSVVLDLNGPVALLQGQAAGYLSLALGNTEIARAASTRLIVTTLASGATFGSPDVFLERDAANIWAQRNLTTAQTLRVYGTTDAGLTNFERVQIETGSNPALRFVAGGTGAARNLSIVNQSNASILLATNNTNRWNLDGSGHLLAASDNSYDIGASGSGRPRNVYIAGTIVAPLIDCTGSLSVYTYVMWGNGLSSRMQAPSNGVITLLNAATTDFTRLQFGGTTSSFPAIGRSNASLVISLADGTLATNILPINTNQLQFGGADAASPGAISLRVQNVLAGTSNTSGQNLSIYGSAGTGDAVGGAILLRVAPAGSTGTSQNATIVGLAVDGTGRIYGAALHNNAAGMSGAVNQYVGSGTYSPTITAVANCSVTTPGVNFKYLRVGNVVQVTGQISVDPTVAATLTRVGISLPIASNLSGTVGCQGTGVCGDVFGYCGAIFPDTTNDRAELNFISDAAVANNVFTVTFSYEVV